MCSRREVDDWTCPLGTSPDQRTSSSPRRRVPGSRRQIRRPLHPQVAAIGTLRPDAGTGTFLNSPSADHRPDRDAQPFRSVNPTTGRSGPGLAAVMTGTTKSTLAKVSPTCEPYYITWPEARPLKWNSIQCFQTVLQIPAIPDPENCLRDMLRPSEIQLRTDTSDIAIPHLRSWLRLGLTIAQRVDGGTREGQEPFPVQRGPDTPSFQIEELKLSSELPDGPEGQCRPRNVQSFRVR